jgi:hypothetical protein
MENLLMRKRWVMLKKPKKLKKLKKQKIPPMLTTQIFNSDKVRTT